MAIRELIEQIAVGWPSYFQKGRVDKHDRIYELVTSHRTSDPKKCDQRGEGNLVIFGFRGLLRLFLDES
jgi:hypothetical protein